jgi:hypothetical protein
MRKIVVLALLSLLMALAVFPAAAQESKPVVTLERSACFGGCPVYTVTIYEDGTVVYEGTRFVEVTGRQTIQIEEARVAEIVQAFEAAGYFEWEDEYIYASVTDGATFITSVSLDGHTKQIVHYSGDDTAPILLSYLENWIDRSVYTQQWTGVEPELPHFTSAGAPVITLERQPCFGFCPVYWLVIHEDGTVIYMGFQNVAEVGVRSTSIDAEEVAALADDMAQQGYFDWEDEYLVQNVTDHPTVITSLMWEGNYKHIVRYEGDFSAPDELADLEDAIDHAVDVSQWL